MAAQQHEYMKYDSKQRLGLYGLPSQPASLPQSQGMPHSDVKPGEAQQARAVQEATAPVMKHHAVSMRVLPITRVT
eukprot:CAMPEP_0197666634 /NCGR_PEP_ID=MMETSP1338-20131121/63287_1 /TAXON_ID=43686 ORGANISM="Pelagodinium beii, Strain RCC1491" /NCGR_SAMPLE_ID=MMETSP1338 /ASSEMBLY_ACC=CAM_ASM_000754 /LENGTH=75 /DNA_ID=CAMNT_0043245697 /DNA_START=252 /DNA_END=479 /DNA_ORIENTATION=-